MVDSNTNSSSRLTSLTQIVREIDSAADLESALRLLVHRTREVMGADVCTVYFTDEASRRHVAAATDGLSSRIVGNVQFEFGTGLIGRVAESRQPVNLDRVPQALDQSFLEQTGTKPYQGFLGVPVRSSIVTRSASMRWMTLICGSVISENLYPKPTT